MIIGAEKVLEWIKANETPYWRILQGEKGGVIVTSETKENLTVDDSIERLKNSLALLSANSYFIDAWYIGIPQNNRFKTRFVLNDMASIGAMSLIQREQNPIDIQAEIGKALDNYKKEQELERLKVENTELQQEINSANFRILNRLEPYMGSIVEALLPGVKQLPISGTAPNKLNQNEEMATVQEQERVEKSLADWSEKDADFITLIEKISALAKSDPATYTMAKQMLMNK